MRLNYLLDLGSESYSLINTPNISGFKLPFYLEAGGFYNAHSKYFTEREGYNSFLIIYTINGQGLLKYRNKEVVLDKNSLVFIDCNEYQYYKTLKDSWEFKYLHINGSGCKSYFELINEEDLSIIKVREGGDFLEKFTAACSLTTLNDLFSDIKKSNALSDLLTTICSYKYSNIEKNKSNYREEIKKVERYMEVNFSNKISIEELSSLIHISKFYFLRLFKSYVGVTPYQYLTKIRINKSKDYLKGTSLTIEEIAYRVGYINVNNYIRDFKRYSNLTPNKFRKYYI